MSKKIILFLVLFVGILLLIWIARPKDNAADTHAGKESSLMASESMFDFGVISMAAGGVRHQFSVTNETSTPIRVKEVYTSCMCTSAEISLGQENYGSFGMRGMGRSTVTDILFRPGDTASVDVTYDPAAHGPAGVGSIDRFIYLRDENDGQLQIEIRATVTP